MTFSIRDLTGPYSDTPEVTGVGQCTCMYVCVCVCVCVCACVCVYVYRGEDHDIPYLTRPYIVIHLRLQE